MRFHLRHALLAVLLTFCSGSAYATDLVAKKLTFDPLPRVNRAGRVGLEITNSGAVASGAYSVRFTIRLLDNTVYQQTIPGSTILAEASANVWTPYTFTPATQGIYEATAEILHTGETDPSDNSIIATCNPLPAFIPRDAAVSLLDQQLRRTHAAYVEPHAYYIPVTDGTGDSVHLPGAVLTFANGTVQTLATPSYVFFVDLEPTTLFGHPTLAVTVPAESGSKDSMTVRESMLPFLLNGAGIPFGAYCGPNPQRVIGQGFDCQTPPAFTSENTENNRTCVLVVTGATIRDVDDATMQHDVSSYITRMNSAPRGPRVSAGGFLLRRGANRAGITRQELRAEINRLAAAACSSFVLKYIGHSNEQGLLISGSDFYGTDLLTWSELASMMKSIDASDITVDLTTNGAKRVLPSLRSQAILGSFIASTDSATRMPIGSGSGTFWEHAQTVSMSNPKADADWNDTVSVTDAARHAVATHAPGDSVRRSNPSLTDLDLPSRPMLSEVRGFVSGRLRIQTDNYQLFVTTENFRVATSVKQGSQRRDTVVEGFMIYLDNRSEMDLRAKEDYAIIATSGRGSSRIDSVVAIIRPLIRANQRIAIAELPAGFTGVATRPASKLGDPSANETYEAYIEVQSSALIAEHPTRFRTTLSFQDNGETNRYVTWTDKSGSLGPNRQLPRLVKSSANDVTTFSVSGSLTSSVHGARLFTLLSDENTYSVTTFFTNILRPVQGDATATIPDKLQWNDATVHAGNHTLRSAHNSCVRVDSSATIVPARGSFDLHSSLLEFTGSTNPSIAWGDAASDSILVQDVCLTGAGRLTIAHRNITLQSFRLGTAALTLRPSQGDHHIRTIGAYGSRGDGITVDLPTGTSSYVIYGAHVVRPDNFDIRVTGSGTVHCVDCSIDLTNTIVASGSALHLRQNISAIVTDAGGSPKSGIKVDVVGRTGTLLASKTTDDAGFANFDTVLVGITTNKLVDHRPVTVRMTSADRSTQEHQVSTSLWSQVRFVDSTMVSVTESPTDGLSVSPLPLTRDSDAYVTDESGINSIDVVTLTGHVVDHVPGDGSRRLRVQTAQLGAGMYLFVVTTPTGQRTIPAIVR